MAAYVVRRVFLAAFTSLVISFLSFVIIQLPPGDYVDFWADTWYAVNILDDCCTEEQKEELREQFGLNQPMLKQYWDWISGIVLHADFGDAFLVGIRQPARKLIVERLPVTIALTSFTILLTWTFAIPIGIYSAVRHHSVGDYTFTFLGFTGLAVPDFLLAWCSCTSSSHSSTRASAASSRATTWTCPGASAGSWTCSSI